MIKMRNNNKQNWIVVFAVSFVIVFIQPVWAGDKKIINNIKINCTEDGKKFILDFEGYVKAGIYAKENRWKIFINDNQQKLEKISYECKLNEHIKVVTEIDTKLVAVYSESFTSGHSIRKLEKSPLDVFIKNDDRLIGELLGVGIRGKINVNIDQDKIRYCSGEECSFVNMNDLLSSSVPQQMYGDRIHRIE